jgi:hypothetical protein
MPYLLGFAVSIGLFLAYVASRPSAFRIERSRTLNARPEAVFALINDFREWAKWSPWDKLDPGLKRTYEGPASGKGAVYRWEGNGKAGAGSMTINETSPARIEIALNLLKPFPANNRAIFTMEPDGDRTKLTWAMEGENPLPRQGLRRLRQRAGARRQGLREGLRRHAGGRRPGLIAVATTRCAWRAGRCGTTRDGPAAR